MLLCLAPLAGWAQPDPPNASAYMRTNVLRSATAAAARAAMNIVANNWTASSDQFAVDANNQLYLKRGATGTNLALYGGSFPLGRVTNGGVVWFVTNNTPNEALPDGSLASVTDGRFYTRTNGVWILGGGGGSSGWDPTSGAPANGAGVTNTFSSVLRLSSKGIKNGLSTIPNAGADFGPDTPGTSSCGIQEAFNTISQSAVVNENARDCTLNFAPGYYFFTNNLWYSNASIVTLKMQSGGTMVGTKLVYAGTQANTNLITITGSSAVNWAPVNVFIRDIGFTSLTNTCNVMLHADHYGYLTVEDCMFSSWQIMTNHTEGANPSTASWDHALAQPGLVGIYCGDAPYGGDHETSFRNVLLEDLATGIATIADHPYFYGIKTSKIGIGNSDTYNEPANLWPDTSPFSIGAAVLQLRPPIEGAFYQPHFYGCAVGIALCYTNGEYYFTPPAGEVVISPDCEAVWTALVATPIWDTPLLELVYSPHVQTNSQNDPLLGWSEATLNISPYSIGGSVSGRYSRNVILETTPESRWFIRNGRAWGQITYRNNDTYTSPTAQNVYAVVTETFQSASGTLGVSGGSVAAITNTFGSGVFRVSYSVNATTLTADAYRVVVLTNGVAYSPSETVNSANGDTRVMCSTMLIPLRLGDYPGEQVVH